jgi:ANTAR domain
VIVDVGSGDSTWLDAERWEASRRETRALRQRSEQARARARMTRHKVLVARSHQERLADSGAAWLQARLGTMPVIEQAKGIVIAQQRCGPGEAFDVLRRASQQTNIKLHVLAAQIVEHFASSADRGNVTPISLGTRRSQRSQAADTATHRA